jgi:uncharacterized membrane protein
MISSLSLVPIAVGILLITFGGTMLFTTRDRPADTKWLRYGLAVPALGCGGVLLISPLITFLGTWLIAFGVVEFCKTQAAC